MTDTSRIQTLLVLNDAVKLLARTRWTRGALARTRKGKSVLYGHPEASAFCLLGAVDRAAMERFGAGNEVFLSAIERAVDALAKRLVARGESTDYGSSVPTCFIWNDRFAKTQERVSALLCETIHALEADLGSED